MRPARVLTLAAALAATLAAGCARPPDEAWLRFLGFRATGATDSVTVLEGELLDETTDSLDAAFANTTVSVGRADAGTGILVERARVEYRLQGASAPSYEYPLSLYLAAPKTGETTEGTLSGLPIVPASLKTWILASGVAGHPEVSLTARVRFSALTDDGNRLEVEGSIQVVLANAGGGGGGGGGGGAATVSIVASDPAADESSDAPGAFTVRRTGSTAGSLAVFFDTSGTATEGSDYNALGGSVGIPAGSATVNIPVDPLPDSEAEDPETVIVTLRPGSGYTVDATSNSATVTITD